MCGEKTVMVKGQERHLGSPPHVRGKGMLAGIPSMMVRITPACAGKRDHVSIMLKAFGDHPRMCGEKISLVIRLKTKMGSPPHVRGKVFRLRLFQCGDGITPACAGKSGDSSTAGSSG